MDDVAKVKQKVDIVEIIGEYVTLKKAGRNFKGLCPFHLEKSPSFMVSPERQIFHCFGCSKGGDVFTFLEEYEKLDFGETLKILAQRVGIQLSGSYIKSDTEKKKDIIYSLNSLATQFYQYLLLEHSVGKHALSYLTETRKIPLGLIKKFQLGYAPSENPLTRYMTQKKKQNIQNLSDAGLISIKNARPFDFFRNRIIFPIFDTRDNIIAFSGRALENQTLPKYINTRETLVYRKGDTLFGLNFARDDIKKEEKVIIVEGEFDVISAFHEGIKNIVAVKGTALTESQIKVLKRYTPKFAFCFDTDPAGTAAQRRSIELIEKEGITASVIIPPHGKDPDELLHENPAEFKQAMKHDKNIYDFIIDSAVSGIDLTNPDDKKLVLDKTLDYLMHIDNEVIKEHYLKKLAQILDTSYDSLLRQGEKIPAPRVQIVQQATPAAQSREEITEEYLLSLLFQSSHIKDYCNLVEYVLSSISFSVPIYNKLFTFLKTFCVQQTAFSIPDFALTLPQEILEQFDKIYLLPIQQFKDEKEYKEEIEKTAREVKILSIKKALQGLTVQMKEKEGKSDEIEIESLRTEFGKLTDQLK